ncbi:hypothetical protein [Nostoc sp.]
MGDVYEGLRLLNGAFKVTLYFEKADPQTFWLEFSPKTCLKSNYEP